MLELADPLAEAATEIGQFPGPENDQHDQEDENQVSRLKQTSTHRTPPLTEPGEHRRAPRSYAGASQAAVRRFSSPRPSSLSRLPRRRAERP